MNVTVDHAGFLRAHFDWCKNQIHLEVQNELGDLLWIHDDLATLATEFLSQYGIDTRVRFFVQRLARSLRARYPDFWVDQRLGPDASMTVVEHFDDFVTRRLTESSKRGWRSPFPGERRTRQVIRELRSQSALALADEAGVGLVASERLGDWFVRTYFAPERRGFAYWHDLARSPDGRALFRESFRSWFGLGLETRFQAFEHYGPREVAEFVLRKVESYRAFILSLARESG